MLRSRRQFEDRKRTVAKCELGFRWERDRRPLLDPAFRSLIHDAPPKVKTSSFPERHSGGSDGRIRLDDRRHRPRLRDRGQRDGNQYPDNPGNADEQPVGRCAVNRPTTRLFASLGPSAAAGRSRSQECRGAVSSGRRGSLLRPRCLTPPVPELDDNLENLGPRWKRPTIFSLVTFDRPKKLELFDCVLTFTCRRIHMATPAARHAGSVGAQRLLARPTINPLFNRLNLRNQPCAACDVANSLEPGSHRVSPPEATRQGADGHPLNAGQDQRSVVDSYSSLEKRPRRHRQWRVY
jgi:hypothetical protein